MTVELTIEGAEQLLKGVTIPPRPTLLVDINKELTRDDPDLRHVAALVAKDVGISAAVLKTINSPLFGLRSKVGSIPQAVQMLGGNNVRNIVTGLALRAAMGGNSQSLERFWDSSEKVACIAVHICNVLPRSPREEAYTFGIFHDCGIPLLMQRFPEYKDTLQAAAKDERPITTVEDERHGTNHAVLGYMVAKSWGLPPVICEGLLRHHDLTVFNPGDTVNPVARTLIAVTLLAEHLNDTMIRLRSDESWERVADTVLDYLGLSGDEYDELKEDVVSIVG